VPPVADDLPGGVAVRLIAGSALLAAGHVVQDGLDGRTVGVGTLEIKKNNVLMWKDWGFCLMG
jgi:hypothetical protein